MGCRNGNEIISDIVLFKGTIFLIFVINLQKDFCLIGDTKV